MADKVKHTSLRELIEEHRQNGGAASTHEFSDLWITDVGSPEGDLSGIIIKNSTFSGVDFAKVTLTNARLTNVQFEAASNLTIACDDRPNRKSPSKKDAGASTVQLAVLPQQLVLQFETSPMPAPIASVTPLAPDLSIALQRIRTLNAMEIRALIEESKRRIQESRDKKNSPYRPEQERFRRDLLEGYNHQCAITSAVGDGILQAAHILSFCLLERVEVGQFGNSQWNGVLLRQELHTLFDQNQLQIAENGEVFVDSYYQDLYGISLGQVVFPPSSSEDPKIRAEHEQVWRSFLRWRWEEYGKY